MENLVDSQNISLVALCSVSEFSEIKRSQPDLRFISLIIHCYRKNNLIKSHGVISHISHVGNTWSSVSELILINTVRVDQIRDISFGDVFARYNEVAKISWVLLERGIFLGDVTVDLLLKCARFTACSVLRTLPLKPLSMKVHKFAGPTEFTFSEMPICLAYMLVEFTSTMNDYLDANTYHDKIRIANAKLKDWRRYATAMDSFDEEGSMTPAAIMSAVSFKDISYVSSLLLKVLNESDDNSFNPDAYFRAVVESDRLASLSWTGRHSIEFIFCDSDDEDEQ